MKLFCKYIKIFFAMLIFFILTEIFYVFCLPKVINESSLTERAALLFQEKSGMISDIENPEFKTYFDFSISLKADKAMIFNKNNKKVFGAENIFIRLQPFKIIFKELNIKELCSKKAEINISELDEKLLNKLIKRYETKFFNIRGDKAKIETDGYKIFYYDKSRKKELILEGQTFDIRPTGKGLSALTTDGVFKIGDKTAEFNINILSKFLFRKKFNFKDFSVTGKVTGFELSAFEPYLNCFGKFERASGKADIFFNSSFVDKRTNLSEINIKTTDISINGGDFEHQIKADGESKIKVKFKAFSKTFEVVELSADGEGFSVQGNGKIENYFSDKPYINISILLSPSKAEKILDLLPYGICSEINTIKKSGVEGDISTSIKVIGKFPDLKFFGTAKAENIAVLRGRTVPHKGNIKITFHEEEANIDIYVETPDKEKFFMKGSAQIFDKKPSIFDIKTTDKMSGKLACDILVPVSQIFNFEIGPVAFLDVEKGYGKAKLHINGTKKVAKLDGKIEIKSAKGRFNDINADLRTDLNLIFSGTDIFYKAEKATVNGYSAYFNGKTTTLGDVDLKFGIKTADTQAVLNILKTSPLLTETKDSINFVRRASGKVDISLNILGNIPVGQNKNLSREEIIENFKKLKTDGKISLKNNTLYLSEFNMPLSGINGITDFTEKSLNAKNLNAYLGNSPVKISINGEIPNNSEGIKAKIDIYGKSVILKDSLNFVLQSGFAEGFMFPKGLVDSLNGKHNLVLTVNALGNKIDIKSLNAKLDFIPTENNLRMVNVFNGNIAVENGNVFINKLEIGKNKSKLKVQGLIEDFYLLKPKYNLNLFGSNLSVNVITDIASSVPDNIGRIIRMCKNYYGFADLNLKITNNGADGHVNFRNFKFRHIKSDVPFNFSYLPIKITNNTITFDNISGITGNTVQSPIFLNAVIKNYMKIPYIKATVAMKPTSAFIERYLNTKLSHPLKVTGDISVNAEINGSFDSLLIEPVIKVNKESDIIYLSSNLGDTEFLRVLDGKIFIKTNKIIVPKMKYTKFQTTTENKTYPITVFEFGGEAVCQGKVYTPQNAFFRTNYNIPAKFLNFIFKKSLIKSGSVFCNLKYTNDFGKGLITGIVEATDIDIPLYNIKVNRGKVNLKNKTGYISADCNLGEIKCKIYSKIINSIKTPVIVQELKIKTGYANLENLLTELNKWSIDAYMNTALQSKVTMKISDFIIENGSIDAKQISYKNLPIKDFSANFSLDNNSLLKMTTNNFDITDGKVLGKISYDIRKGNTEAYLTMKNIDSNSTAEAFLGLNNQINGKLNGEAKISTKGFDDISRLKNLSGNISFSVADGNMPKLGSIEYLLRASNIIYSGLTTLSVNNLIELFKPFKQGSFTGINGELHIENGIINDIEIFSKGAGMSLYINGDYDIENSNANIKIFGKLGKNIDNMIGPVGNLSANTLLKFIPREKETNIYEQEIKKIPEINNNKDVKIFRATVEGDINSSNSASSFKWIE